MAGLLNSLVYIAADPAVTEPGGQAAAGSRLRYSRLNEQEADDLGIQNQVAAGWILAALLRCLSYCRMNHPMAAYNRPIFCAHPITEIRIADAKIALPLTPSKSMKTAGTSN